MKNKLISIILMLTVLFSFSAMPTLASEPIFNIDLDSENAKVNIFYKYPVYSNCNVGISILNNDTNEIVYFNQVVSGVRGTVMINDISLGSSGSYTVKVWPQNAASPLSDTFDYFSREDILRLWNITAVNGTAEQIAGEWPVILRLFKLDSQYYDGIADMSTFYGKLVSQRGDTFADMTDANKTELAALANLMALLTSIEECSEADSVKPLIADALALTSASDAQLCAEWQSCAASDYYNDAVKRFISVKSVINTLVDVTAAADKALDIYRTALLLDRIAAVTHTSEISSIVTDEDNARLLGISSYLPAYSALGSTSAVDEAAAGRFDSAESFAKAFADAIALAQSSETKPAYPSKSSSGGGGGGGVSQITSSAPVDRTPFNPFTDIADIDWAKEHIIALYNLGAVNGKTATEFKPYDSITREEFVKLIVCLMKLPAADDAEPFGDVAADSWYCPYVCSAVAAGVVNGIGGGMFGTGLRAARQDIAVMIVNALEANGIQITSATAAFADAADISDYACGAVGFLHEQGIITGDENGRFNPKANATRAEVAVMLSRIYTNYTWEGK